MGMWSFRYKIDSLILISGSGLYYLIKHGDEMRAGIDIGFSAVENNNGKLSIRTGIQYIDKP